MIEASLGHLLLGAIPFITRVATTEQVQVMGKFLEEVIVVIARHTAKDQIDKAHGGLRTKLLSYAQESAKPPGNHDLQKAFYTSFLQATEVVFLIRLEQLGVKLSETSCLRGLTRHLVE